MVLITPPASQKKRVSDMSKNILAIYKICQGILLSIKASLKPPWMKVWINKWKNKEWWDGLSISV